MSQICMRYCSLLMTWTRELAYSFLARWSLSRAGVILQKPSEAQVRQSASSDVALQEDEERWRDSRVVGLLAPRVDALGPLPPSRPKQILRPNDPLALHLQSRCSRLLVPLLVGSPPLLDLVGGRRVLDVKVDCRSSVAGGHEETQAHRCQTRRLFKSNDRGKERTRRAAQVCPRHPSRHCRRPRPQASDDQQATAGSEGRSGRTEPIAASSTRPRQFPDQTAIRRRSKSSRGAVYLVNFEHAGHPGPGREGKVVLVRPVVLVGGDHVGQDGLAVVDDDRGRGWERASVVVVHRSCLTSAVLLGVAFEGSVQMVWRRTCALRSTDPILMDTHPLALLCPIANTSKQQQKQS